MYKISYTNLNQTGGVNQLKDYQNFYTIKPKNSNLDLKNKEIEYGGVKYKFHNKKKIKQALPLPNPVEQLVKIIKEYEKTLAPQNLSNAPYISTIKSVLSPETLGPKANKESVYKNYQNKTMQELIDLYESGEVNDEFGYQFWIQALLNINSQYLIAKESGLVEPSSLTDKTNNMLNDQEITYLKTYLIALNEVYKLNRTGIMTPNLMDFFYKNLGGNLQLYKKHLIFLYE